MSSALLTLPGVAPVPSDRLRPDAALLPQLIDHPSGYLALATQNSFFSQPPAAGFIAYRRHGRHLFLFGGVHAPEAQRASLLDAFLAHAARLDCAVVAVQLRLPQLALFATRGFTVNPLGTSFGLHLPDFRLAGTRRMKLRNKIGRARRLGLRVRELGRELPRSPASFAALQAISDRWLRRKGKKELDFMIGELGTLVTEASDDRRRRIFVVEQAEPVAPSEAVAPLANKYQHKKDHQFSNSWLGFITYVPVYGQHPGYLHDLTRRLPEAPPGAMELCNAEAMARLQAEGARYLHFGFTPFITRPEDADLPAINSSSWLDLAIRLLARYGRLVYPAQSQADYKRKWGPDLIEPEYVAAQALSLRAIWDLLRLTRSL